MADKRVDLLSKILNQAERAEEGSPEREAFMEKAVAMSQAFSIDLAIARAHQANKEKVEMPERRQFKVGIQAPRMTNRNAHFVDLMLAICDTNDIQVVISSSNVYVFGTGMPSDLDVAERLFSLLSVQMVSEADAQIKAGAHCEMQRVPKRVRVKLEEEDRAWGQHDGSSTGRTESFYYDERDEDIRETWVNGKLRPARQRYDYRADCHEWVASYPPPTHALKDIPGEFEERLVPVEDARVWRTNFYAGFVNRTRYRLREARNKALREAGVDLADEASSGAVALRDKAKEVREAFEENEKFVLSNSKSFYGGAQLGRHSYGGREAGDEAGQRAKLGDEKDLGRS